MTRPGEFFNPFLEKSGEFPETLKSARCCAARHPNEKTPPKKLDGEVFRGDRVGGF
jgi:hypothetical protein